MEPRTLGEVRLTTDFVPFDGRVRMLTRARPSARLYWFPGEVRMGLQVKLQASSFATFCEYVQATVAPIVMVFDDATDRSPEQPPAATLLPPAAELETPDAAAVPRSTHSRSTSVQQSFREELRRREGGVSCALCSERPQHEMAVDAAHVAPLVRCNLHSCQRRDSLA